MTEQGFAIAVVGLMLFLFGLVIGVRLGEELSKRCITTRQYWLANLAVFGAGIVCSAVVVAIGLVVGSAVVIGLLGGTIAGLKFGFGESTGPWKVHDRAFNVNKGQMAAARSGRAEQNRRRRAEGGPEPELMSVETGGTSGDAKTEKGSHKG